MTTIREDAAQLLRSIYRLHEVEPGFQVDAASSYGVIADGAEAIIRAARIMDRNAVKRCNGIERWNGRARMVLASWTEADEAKAEKSDDAAEAKVKAALAAIYGATWPERIDLETCGDPRGPMVKLWAKGFRDHGSPRISV